MRKSNIDSNLNLSFTFSEDNKSTDTCMRYVSPKCVSQRHLANAATLNVASAFLQMNGKKELRFIRSCCVVHSTRYSYVPTSKEIADLRMIGCVVDEFDVQGFKVANIMGVQFRAGKDRVDHRYREYFCILNIFTFL